MNKTYIIIFVFISLLNNITSQVIFNDLQFTKDNSIPFSEKNKKLLYPWLGGIDNVQFCEIDLNFDKIQDLLIYDRHSELVHTFINLGIRDSTSYKYTEKYNNIFSFINEWVHIHDYNNDDKKDIFTYKNGAIIVYKNISSNNSIKFEKHIDILTSLQDGNYINIPVSSVNYPAINDIDNDGDIDILCLSSMGYYVQYHQNQSIEKYGNTDSLTFVKVKNCWGHFSEDNESHKLKLDINCYEKSNNNKHSGSSFLAIDIDNDNDKDLLISDIDNPNISLLINGGNNDSAYIISIDTLFPYYSTPINLYSFPACFYIDINNDDKKDLIISPFNQNTKNSKNYNNVLLYNNCGTKEIPIFNYNSNNFIQKEIIDFGSRSMPVIFDYNNDELLDIIIGNRGYYDTSYISNGVLNTNFHSCLSLVKNTGTKNKPEYTLINRDWLGLSSLNKTSLFPAIADIDNDNDNDIFLGCEDGTIIFIENLSGNNSYIMNQPVFNYSGIDVGNNSTPQLFDLSGDSILDLIIGEKDGNLNYYNNIGTKHSPSFLLNNDSLGDINITDFTSSWYGYSIPCFSRNNNNDLVLYIGSASGDVFNFYSNDLSSIYQFRKVQLSNIFSGNYSSPSVLDINNDKIIDMIIGNISGGLSIYYGDTTFLQSISKTKQNNYISIFPNPITNSYVSINSQNQNIINVTLYSVHGQLIKQIQTNILTNTLKLNVSNFKSGLYFLHIETKSNITGNINSNYRKIIIQSTY